MRVIVASSNSSIEMMFMWRVNLPVMSFLPPPGGPMAATSSCRTDSGSFSLHSGLYVLMILCGDNMQNIVQAFEKKLKALISKPQQFCRTIQEFVVTYGFTRIHWANEAFKTPKASKEKS
ncbi:hypothetical protein DPMN_030207 [Dreissena polymorpha]|uniref:Uncharacterized protein n=1 Tax=Dreissena polymorpha TaxID=45954 RepID=A0A9D4LXS1_DREPO|nr:hypothetical protein DPMN_030207 [Dreissena polymorpha]